MGGRINTIMQTCFFAISGVLPREEAIAAIKYAIRRPTASAARRSCRRTSPPSMQRWQICMKSKFPSQSFSTVRSPPAVPAAGARFRARSARARSSPGDGDCLPVSAMPVDGTFPSGTAQWEKRNIALEIPVWDEDLCIQCGKCVLVCPHAVIRAKVYDDDTLDKRARSFQAAAGKLERPADT